MMLHNTIHLTKEEFFGTYVLAAESPFFEKKQLSDSPARVTHEIVGMANTDGGTIIVGVGDKETTPPFSNAKIYADFDSYIAEILKLSPRPDISIKYITAETVPGIFLEVKVESGIQVYVSASNDVYVREGTATRRITHPDERQQLYYSKGAHHYENQVINDVSIKKLTASPYLLDFMKFRNISRLPQDYLDYEGLIGPGDKPSVAALLLFAEKPSACLNKKCSIVIAFFNSQFKHAGRSADSQRVEVPLKNQVFDTVDIIQKWLSQQKVFSDGKLVLVQYPRETLHEFISNAVIHRDYSVSDDIRINVYHDKIEIISPGPLPGNLRIESILKDNRRLSRNPKITRLLNLHNPPVNKDMGEGLRTAFLKMREQKLKDPIIEQTKDYVKVTILYQRIAKYEDQILEYVKTHNSINNLQARELCKVDSPHIILDAFHKLRDIGAIEVVPGTNGNATRWQLKVLAKDDTSNQSFEPATGQYLLFDSPLSQTTKTKVDSTNSNK